IPFAMAGITNVSEEHLDYFVTYELYLQTKAELLLQAKKAIIPAEERCTKPLRSLLKNAKKPWLEYSPVSGSDSVAQAIRERFPEKYNQKNAQLVRKMAQELGVSDEVLITAYTSFPGV